MEKDQKTLHVYYKDSVQKIKVYDKTGEDQILKLIKRIFKITAPDEKIYFQDKNGDLLILPEVFPQDLSIYIYIEPEYPEPNKQIEHSTENILPGFKWITVAGENYVSDDGYIFIAPNKRTRSDGCSTVHSTTTYTKGKLFCKLLWKPQTFQSIGVVSPDEEVKELYYFLGDTNVFDSVYLVPEFGGPFYISFLLNMDEKYMEFFILDGKDGNVKETHKLTFNYSKVVIYAGGKKYGSIQILEGGSSPIPEYALKKKTKDSICIII